MIAALVLSLFVGLALGVLGSGGSIVMVPLLVYVAGLPTDQAVIVSLVVVGATSALAAYMHARAGHFHWRAVKFLSLTGVAGSMAGAQLTHLVEPRALMLSFSALMLMVGVAMIRGRSEPETAPQCRPKLCMSIGGCIGVLTGFLGVGGGFLIVPSLVFLAGIDTASAIGASLAIIALNSVGGLFGHLAATDIPWSVAAAFLAMAVAGMTVGARFGSRLPERALRVAFAWAVVSIGLVIGAANLIV